jgi:hypothetical protein
VIAPRLLVASWLVVSTGCGGGGDDSATTAPMTTAPTTTAGATGEPTETGDGGGDNSGDTAAATTGFDGLMCSSVDECRLVSTCCSCEAIHRDADPPAACDATCDRPMCDVWGVSEMLCSHGCHLLLVECDAAMIECADPPPACEAGFVPSLDDRCWSGHCVPESLCRPI